MSLNNHQLLETGLLLLSASWAVVIFVILCNVVREMKNKLELQCYFPIASMCLLSKCFLVKGINVFLKSFKFPLENISIRVMCVEYMKCSS